MNSSNDNRRPMSPFGKMLFDMLNDMNRVNAATLRQGNSMALRTKPTIIDPITRISKEQKQ